MLFLEIVRLSQNTFIYVNTTFVVVCIAMAVVFLAIPLPSKAGLRKYRISLRFLAVTYLSLALLKVLLMSFGISKVNLISMERLTISSLQAILFTIVLIKLLNPKFAVKRFLFIHLIPLAVLNAGYQIVATIWGNPTILDVDELIKSAIHPAILIREIFVVFYVCQLVYFTRLFLSEAKKYEDEIDNYFVDTIRLHLPGVRFNYFSSLTIGIIALVSCFVFSEVWVIIFTSVFAIFYMGFGMLYIQYPNTFAEIEPVIYPGYPAVDEKLKVNVPVDWSELKSRILTDKYYLRQGVNIEEMARFLKIGRTKLSMLINKEEGMNFNTWINSLRIEEAKKLFLKHPEYTLTEISEMVGYSEPSNFSRQFKLIASESPSSWRQIRLYQDSV